MVEETTNRATPTHWPDARSICKPAERFETISATPEVGNASLDRWPITSPRRVMLSTLILTIAGMKTNACRERVAAAISAVPGVRDVSVSLVRGRAVVLYGPPCTPAQLFRIIAHAGFQASNEGPST